MKTTVTLVSNAKPSGDLVVEALSASKTPILLAAASADGSGRAELDLPEVLLTSLFGTERPDVFFRVLSADNLLADTADSVHWHSGEGERSFRIELDDPMAGGPTPHGVRGQVHGADATPGWTVEILDQPLRGDAVALGGGQLDDDGFYAIEYSRLQLSPPEKLLADLILVVRDDLGVERFRSNLLRCAAPTLILDPVLDSVSAAGPSAFDRVTNTVGPWLGQTPPSELEEGELEKLACSTKIEGGVLGAWASAHRLANELALSDPPLAIEAKVAFALHASGASTSAAVRALREEELRARLEAASEANLLDIDESGITNALQSFANEFAPISPQGDPQRPPDTPRTGIDLVNLVALVLDGPRATTFAAAWFAHQGKPEEFWDSLNQVGGFDDPADIQRAQLVLRLDSLTSGNFALTSKLISDGINSVADLVRYDEAAWANLLSGTGIDAIQETAQAMAATIEIAYPHAYVTTRMAENPRADELILVDLLAQYPEFDLANTSPRAFTANHALAAEAQEALAKATRVFRMVRGPDRLERMRTLVDRNLDSAPRITRMGKVAFLNHHAEALGGQDSAMMVWRRAASATMVAHTAMMGFRNGLNRVQPRAAGAGANGTLTRHDESAEQAGMPGWSELFGSFDACSCEHCRSVLSPAAYLCDALHFLADPPTGGNHQDWYDKLVERRPDIPRIHLDCRNTNTMLPTIDLINEVLEHAVVGGVNEAAGRQTTGLSGDLALHPEHLDGGAYGILAQAGTRHPWNLPFDLATEEVRAYLPLASTNRAALLDALGTNHPTATPSDALRQAIACEHIGLNPAVQSIVTGPGTAGDWGLGDADAAWTTPSTESVRAWMRRAQLDYEAFDEALRAGYVNPADADGYRVRVAFAEGSCDLDAAHLTVSNGQSDWGAAAEIEPWIRDVLTRLPRFERLRRCLDWSRYDLDKALVALGGTLDADGDGYSATLTGVVELQRLCADLDLPVEEVVSLWGSLPTDAPRPDSASIYDRRFQDPSRGDVDANFVLNVSRTEIAADPPSTMATLLPSSNSAQQKTALGALRLAADDLEVLINHLVPDADQTPLNLANLSRVYGAATLARAMKRPVRDFVALLRLTGIDPFASPLETRAFVIEAAAAAKAPLGIDDVTALIMRHRPSLEHNRLGAVLRAMRGIIQDLAAELPPTIDFDGRVLSGVLEQVLPEELDANDRASLAASVVALVRVSELDETVVADWAANGPNAGAETIQSIANWRAAFDAAWTTLSADTELGAVLGRFDAEVQLRDPAWVPNAAQMEAVEHSTGSSRLDFLQGALLIYRREHLAAGPINEALALALELDGDLTTALVGTGIHAAVDVADNLVPAVAATEPAIALFVHSGMVTTLVPEWPEGSPDPIVELYPAQARTLRRLFAAGTVLNALNPSIDELPFIIGELRDEGWLDFDTLPVEPVADAIAIQTTYAAWARLRNAWAVRSTTGGTDGPMPGFLRDARRAVAGQDPAWGGSTFPARIATLVDQLGWAEPDLDLLIGPDGFAAQDSAEVWGDERWWSRLLAAMDLIKNCGLSARHVVALARSLPTSDIAKNLKQSVRAHYDDTSWSLVARPVRDKLRVLQRDALVSWLLVNRFPTFDSANDLYRWFLIDVEMEACGETSRIREAMSAVQLFVQQAMLSGIEDIQPTSADREAWAWMNRYRVWEANRKVFLWPEHWMEPELRDDKSPFFEELEQSILKNEVNQENVEQAYHEYLTKLDSVSRLEVRGAVREVEPEGATDPNTMTVDRLHVVARTRAKPHKYYHRTREPGREGGVWGRMGAMAGHRCRHRWGSSSAGRLESPALPLLASV